MRKNIQQVSQPQGCCLLPRWYTIWHLRGFSSNEITLPETTYLGLKFQEGRNTLRYPPSPCQIPDGTAPWGSGSFFTPIRTCHLQRFLLTFTSAKFPQKIHPSVGKITFSIHLHPLLGLSHLYHILYQISILIFVSPFLSPTFTTCTAVNIHAIARTVTSHQVDGQDLASVVLSSLASAAFRLGFTTCNV